MPASPTLEELENRLFVISFLYLFYFWQIKLPAASAAVDKGILPRLRRPPPLTKQRRTEGTSAAAAASCAVAVVVSAAAAPSLGQSPAWPYDRR